MQDLIAHQDEKKSKEKTILYTDILKHKLVLENLLQTAHMFDNCKLTPLTENKEKK